MQHAPSLPRLGSLKGSLVAALLMLLLAGIVRADIAPGPGERRDPRRPSPVQVPDAPPSPSPERKACSAGLGLLLFGLGVVGAWRLSKTRPPAPGSAS